MPWTRASELDRAIACPASTHLVRIGKKSEAASKAAAWGNTIHEWKETGIWPDGAVYRRRADSLVREGITRESLYLDGRHEVAFALNSKTRAVAVHEGTKEARDAWKAAFGPEWVTGTTDWWGDYLGVPWIDDLKTGKGEYLEKDPTKHQQLRFYALCGALLTGADEIRVSITHWPQYPADGVPKRYWGTLSNHYLCDNFLSIIERARLAALASVDDLDARPGPQCTFCPCAQVCPVGY